MISDIQTNKIKTGRNNPTTFFLAKIEFTYMFKTLVFYFWSGLKYTIYIIRNRAPAATLYIYSKAQKIFIFHFQWLIFFRFTKNLHNSYFKPYDNLRKSDPFYHY